MNKIIKNLIIGDVFFNSALGLIAPIFALFIVLKITQGNAAKAAQVVGVATLLLWILKSLLQIPIGKYLDKKQGEKDDYWVMFFGHVIVALIPFGYLFSTEVWHIYVLYLLQAVGMAMLVPSWYAIFGRHIDLGKEAYEWGTDSTLLGIGVGITGALGGFLMATFNFDIIFIISGILGIISAILLLFIKNEICAK